MVAVIGGIEVDMLPLDGAPEALDKGIVGGAAPAVAANAAARVQERLLIGQARKRGSRYNGARNYGKGLVISLRRPEVTH